MARGPGAHKALAEQLSQLGINRLRIIVTQETKARVDLFLKYDTVGFGKTRQYLNQQGQQIWPSETLRGLRIARRIQRRPVRRTRYANGVTRCTARSILSATDENELGHLDSPGANFTRNHRAAHAQPRT